MGKLFKSGDVVVCISRNLGDDVQIGNKYIVSYYISTNHLVLDGKWWDECSQFQFVSLNDYLLLEREKKIKKIKKKINGKLLHRTLFKRWG